MKRITIMGMTLILMAGCLTGCNSTKQQNDSLLQLVNGLNQAGVKYRLSGTMPMNVEAGLKQAVYFGSPGSNVTIDISNKEGTNAE